MNHFNHLNRFNHFNLYVVSAMRRNATPDTVRTLVLSGRPKMCLELGRRGKANKTSISDLFDIFDIIWPIFFDSFCQQLSSCRSCRSCPFDSAVVFSRSVPVRRLVPALSSGASRPRRVFSRASKSRMKQEKSNKQWETTNQTWQ